MVVAAVVVAAVVIVTVVVVVVAVAVSTKSSIICSMSPKSGLARVIKHFRDNSSCNLCEPLRVQVICMIGWRKLTCFGYV